MPAAIRAIFGSAIPLTRALSQSWQYAARAGALILLLLARRAAVLTLLGAGTSGIALGLTVSSVLLSSRQAGYQPPSPGP